MHTPVMHIPQLPDLSRAGLQRELRRQLRRVEHWHRQAERTMLPLGGADPYARASLALVAARLRRRAFEAALVADRAVQTSARGIP